VEKATDNIVRMFARKGGRGAALAGVDVARDTGPPSATLAEAYARRRKRLALFFQRRTGSAEDAEDLLQELWIRISEGGDGTQPEDPDSWLQKVAINLALNWLRQHRFRSQYMMATEEEVDALDDAPGADRQTQARQSLAVLRELIDELSPKRRRAFLLYRGEGLSLNETAEQMGVSRSTARKQIAAAINFLRGRMSEVGLWP
jgi:RNA polymerase sigma factor (sigma-70 family)